MLARVLARDEIRDPDLKGVSVTVSEVRASPDLKSATVFVTPLGEGVSGAGAADADTVVRGLRRAAPFLQAQIAKEIELRYIPTLRFQADTSFARAERIDRLLREEEAALAGVQDGPQDESPGGRSDGA